MSLSDHFTLEEMTVSSHAKLDPNNNQPVDETTKNNLSRLCLTLMEPVRELLDAPIHVDSGYRSKIVNKLAHGDPKSAHMEGRACDFYPIGKDLYESFEKIRKSDINYDKLIIEQSGMVRWIHIQIARYGATPRRLAFKASVDPETHVASYVEVKS